MNNRQVSRLLRSTLWIAALALPLLCFIAPAFSQGTFTTGNNFVSASIESGFITLYASSSPSNGQSLTFNHESFLTVEVNGKFYSYNPNGGKIGPSGNPQPIDYTLFNPATRKVGDTVSCVWKEQGFDIEQDVYPVAFTSSGVIVLRVKIINHGTTPINAQAQFLLDNDNSSPGGQNGNDNPFMLDRYGFIRNWNDCPPNPVPSFYLAFQNNPDSLDIGTVGIGYENDSFPPRPLGLLPLASIEFGNWPDQQYYTWGEPNGLDRSSFLTDEAALMIGQPMTATPYLPGESDSVTEIFRTAYGTPEWCYDHGQIVGFALYPHHIAWDPATMNYTPNPFQVETFLFPVNAGGASGVTIRQTVENPVRIVSPKPAGGLKKDTTQVQTIGSIYAGGFVDVHWFDSVIVEPSGCTASIPVNIDFDVKASGIDTVFFNPWYCTMSVDCAHPDTSAPGYQNSFFGCDSIQFDTVTAFDNRQFDLGLQDITYSSPDLSAAQYAVTITPAPPYQCISTPVKIVVHQVDTFQSGRVVFQFTDCADNLSRDTICFTAHPPVPDLTAPVFWINPPNPSCHAQCTDWNVTDTQTTARSIDRGVDSIVIVSSTNMTVTGIPAGGKFLPGTLITTLHICVTDSMLDGTIVLRASDTSHNFSFDTVHYCTTADTKAPIITNSAFDNVANAWHVRVADTESWDRGVDSVWVTQADNVVTVPATLPNPIGCKPTYTFDVHVADTSECASVTLNAMDCAGNLATPVTLSFSKNGKPVIAASKTILCTAADSVLLDAGPNYTSYSWSSGQTTQTIEVKTGGNYSVTVGEGGNCQATSDPLTITSSPATPAIAPTGPITLCAPDSAQLDGGAGFATYQWKNGGNDLAGETSEKFWATSSGNYTVAVTNAAGCSGTSSPVSVTINPLPAQPVITASNGVMTSTPAVSYQWNQNGTPIPGATQKTFTATSAVPYTVTITDANGCSNTSLPFSGSGSMTVSVPSMVTAAQPNSLIIPLELTNPQGVPLGITRQFTAVLRFNSTLLIPQQPFVSKALQGSDLVVTYTGSTSATSGIIANLPFLAALGDDSCTSVIIDTFYWNSPNITVNRVNGNFCLTNVCTQGGPQLIDPNGTVSISAPRPNPGATSISIDYHLIEKGETTITIYDVLGHETMQIVNVNATPGSYTVTADVSSLPAGTYIYSLHTPSTVTSNYLKIAR